jgi:hypothetical protein
MQAAHTKGAFVYQLVDDAADEFRNTLAYTFDCEECSNRAWQRLTRATKLVFDYVKDGEANFVRRDKGQWPSDVGARYAEYSRSRTGDVEEPRI